MSTPSVPPAHRANRAAIALVALLLLGVPAVLFAWSDLPAQLWRVGGFVVEEVRLLW